jgi:hypothetical protein
MRRNEGAFHSLLRFGFSLCLDNKSRSQTARIQGRGCLPNGFLIQINISPRIFALIEASG